MCMEQSSILPAFIESFAISISFMAISFCSFMEASVMASMSLCIFIIDASSHFAISSANAGEMKEIANSAATRVDLIIAFLIFVGGREEFPTSNYEERHALLRHHTFVRTASRHKVS